jgi:hypothetical protein
MKYELIIEADLLTTVLDVNDDIIEKVKVIDKDIHFLFNGESHSINLFEFAFYRCKEWAFKHGYALFSAYGGEVSRVIIKNKLDEENDIQIDSLSEMESIIKSCNWIMNTTDTKDKDNDDDIVIDPLSGFNMKELKNG